MKTMKKLFALLLALTLCLSLGVCAFAEETEETEETTPIEAVEYFTKTYVVNNATNGTANIVPAETLTFTVECTGKPDRYTAGDEDDLLVVGDGNTYAVSGASLTYEIPLTFNGGVTTGLEVGYYYYTITEANENTSQGVEYGTTTANENVIYVTVLVSYDETNNNAIDVKMYLAQSEGVGKYESIENTYSLGSLTVSKTVTGNLSDTRDVFLVDVTFTSASAVNSTVSYSGGVEVTDDEGTVTVPASGTVDFVVNAAGGYTGAVTIAVSDGTDVVFTDIPEGVTYTVVEHDYTDGDENTANGGYDKAKYEYSDENETIASGDTDTVTIANNKGTEVRTGVSLDSLPYVLVLAAVLALGGVMIARKRRVEE
ncbi:MAG: hypothetical protein LUH42_01885 [Oscillospiraceae bacterium]|nr:hypothetical protein [Oscillospiraceae bacterium]